MNPFGGGGMREQEAIAAMVWQVQLQQELFSRVKSSCFKKCVQRFKDPDLSVGETACVERCVSKFMQAYEVVGARMLSQQGVATPSPMFTPNPPLPNI